MDSFINLTKSKSQLLDIGALHGVFSLAFVAPSNNRRALSVDASQLAFSKLLYNTHVNQSEQIDPIECAISDRTGEVQMHFEWEHAVSAGTSTNNSFTVLCITGDGLCKQKDFLPDVVKIDVEGHEVKVLNGLANTINNFKPLIFLELHPDRITQEGDKIQDIATFFKERGYKCFDINRKPYPIERIRNIASDERLIFSCTDSLQVTHVS